MFKVVWQTEILIFVPSGRTNHILYCDSEYLEMLWYVTKFIVNSIIWHFFIM